jgi:hypothetical protein
VFQVRDIVERTSDYYNGMGVGDIGTIITVSNNGWSDCLELEEFPGRGKHDATKFKLVGREFKVGDKVRAVGKKGGYAISKDTGVVTSVSFSGGVSVNFEDTGNLYFLPSEVRRGDLELIKENNMSNVEVGQKFNNSCEGLVEVVQVHGGYIITKDIYDGTNDLNVYTESDFAEEYEVEAEELELTIEQIADKFNVSSDKIRIKE